MVTKAFVTIDAIQQAFENHTPPKGPQLETNTPNAGASQNEAMLELLFTKTTTFLYKGSSRSMLLATLLLLNLNIVHGVVHRFMDQLFSLLKNELLPKNNKMPTTSYKTPKEKHVFSTNHCD
jgi:hypothetical protein